MLSAEYMLFYRYNLIQNWLETLTGEAERIKKCKGRVFALQSEPDQTQYSFLVFVYVVHFGECYCSIQVLSSKFLYSSSKFQVYIVSDVLLLLHVLVNYLQIE